MFDFSKRGLRLVIEGEVTLERLREALETAREEVALSMTGVTFRRANIYLNAFNESGEQLDFSDENGKSKIIRFPEFPGESAPRATDRSRSSILTTLSDLRPIYRPSMSKREARMVLNYDPVIENKKNKKMVNLYLRKGLGCNRIPFVNSH